MNVPHGYIETVKSITEVDMWSWSYLGASIRAILFILIVILCKGACKYGLPGSFGKITLQAWVMEGVFAGQWSFMCLKFFARVTSEHVKLWSWRLVFWPLLEVSEPLVDGRSFLAQNRVILLQI